MKDSRKEIGKWTARVLFVLYLLFFATYTIFMRTVGPRRWNFMPFWELRYSLAGGLATFQFLIINILLCIPMGYFGAAAFRNTKKWKIVLLIACYSTTIELIQLITARGLCEFDDVFNNTLGGAIGILCFYGPLEIFDAMAVTIVYGAVMIILEFRQSGSFSFGRVPGVLTKTYVLYIPAHAVISYYIFRLFDMYGDLRSNRGVKAAAVIMLANMLSVLSKFLVQYFTAYHFSAPTLYYLIGFLLQCLLTMYVRKNYICRTPDKSHGGNI